MIYNASTSYSINQTFKIKREIIISKKIWEKYSNDNVDCLFNKLDRLDDVKEYVIEDFEIDDNLSKEENINNYLSKFIWLKFDISTDRFLSFSGSSVPIRPEFIKDVKVEVNEVKYGDLVGKKKSNKNDINFKKVYDKFLYLIFISNKEFQLEKTDINNDNDIKIANNIYMQESKKYNEYLKYLARNNYKTKAEYINVPINIIPHPDYLHDMIINYLNILEYDKNTIRFIASSIIKTKLLSLTDENIKKKYENLFKSNKDLNKLLHELLLSDTAEIEFGLTILDTCNNSMDIFDVDRLDEIKRNLLAYLMRMERYKNVYFLNIFEFFNEEELNRKILSKYCLELSLRYYSNKLLGDRDKAIKKYKLEECLKEINTLSQSDLMMYDIMNSNNLYMYITLIDEEKFNCMKDVLSYNFLKRFKDLVSGVRKLLSNEIIHVEDKLFKKRFSIILNDSLNIATKVFNKDEVIDSLLDSVYEAKFENYLNLNILERCAKVKVIERKLS